MINSRTLLIHGCCNKLRILLFHHCRQGVDVKWFVLNILRLFIQVCKWFAASCRFLRLQVGWLMRSMRLFRSGEIMWCSGHCGSFEGYSDHACRDVLNICHSSSGSLPSLVLINIIWVSRILRCRIWHERFICLSDFGFFIEMQLYSNSFDVIKLLVRVSDRVVKEAHLRKFCRRVFRICLLHKIIEVLLILLLMLLKLLGLTLQLSYLPAHRGLEAARSALNTLALLTTFLASAFQVNWRHRLWGKDSWVIPVSEELSIFKFMWEKLVVICCSDITWSAALHILIQEFLKLRILLNIILVVHDSWLGKIVITNLDEPIWCLHGIAALFCVLSLANLLHIIILLLFLDKCFTSVNALEILSIFEIGGTFENGLIHEELLALL